MRRARRTALFVMLAGVLPTMAACTASTPPTSTLPSVSYPPTAKGTVVDDYFGTKVADPYRWMEDLESKDVAAWVAAQNRVTFAFLETLPMRERFRSTLLCHQNVAGV